MVLVEVYGDKQSTCTQRVLILLEELSLKYTFNQIELLKGEHKNEEFLKLQPFGKVPVVKYDDRILFESRSIMRYIAKNNIENDDLYGGTDVDIWLEVESQNFYPIASKIVYEMVFKQMLNEGSPDHKTVDSYIKKLEGVLDVYEGRLTESKFIGGDNFSIADISHIPYIIQLLHCGYKSIFKDRPNVYKWIKRIVKRDSVEWVCKGGIVQSERINK
jgi:glutathione S-transferase